MGYRYSTDPIRLTEASADLTLACALVAQVPEVNAGSLDVDFTDWKNVHQHIGFLFDIMGACQDTVLQTIRVEGESDDDIEYPSYDPANYPLGCTQLVDAVIQGWGSQPAEATRRPKAMGFAHQATDLKLADVEAALKSLEVTYALGELPKEDYGQSAASLTVSRLRRFDFLNVRLRGATLDETYQLRRDLLGRHGIQLAASLAKHICLSSVDPYSR